LKFIHLSDTHIKNDAYELYGLNPAQRLEAAINSINKNHSDSDFIVITGDLTDRGEIKAYENLKEICDKSIVPIIKLIGNHDSRENFLEIFPKNFQNEGFIQDVMHINNNALIFLDTKIPNTHGGDMCDKRFEWFERQLEENKDKNVYVFMHHPPMSVGIGYMDKIAFASANRIKKLFQKYTNIKHLFFGHLHRPLSGVWANTPYFGVRGTNHQVALKTDDELLHMTVEEQPTYGIITVENDDILIHLHEYLNEDRYATWED